VAIALSNQIYFWNASSCDVSHFLEVEEEGVLVSSLCFSPDGDGLVVGDTGGDVKLFDIQSQSETSTLTSSHGRVGSLAWRNDLVAIGSRDGVVRVVDMRIGCGSSPAFEFQSHSQEVCGLSWSFCEERLASGGNDNSAFIYNLRKGEIEWSISSHEAAVKALSWSPVNHSLLASGGGTNDRTIQIHSSSTGEQVALIEADSQVRERKLGNLFLSLMFL